MITLLCSTSLRSAENLDSALQAIAACGFTTIDLLTIGQWFHINPRDLHEHWDQTIAELDRLLDKHQLSIGATNNGTTVQLHDRSAEACRIRHEEWAATARLMKYYDFTTATIQPLQKDQGRSWSDAFADCVKTLQEQLIFAEKQNLSFALEAHTNGPIETIDEARQICDAIPELSLTLDPTHFIMQGKDIRETEWMIPKTTHIHLRDAAPGKLQTPFGAGTLDFDWFLNTLKDADFKGSISVEYLQLPNDPHDYTDDAMRLRDLIRDRLML